MVCRWCFQHQSATNQKTKGGVLLKRKTSSFVRMNHSCVRNAQLEFEKGAVIVDLLTLTGLRLISPCSDNSFPVLQILSPTSAL
jgi:hypothetical protein